MLYNVVVIRRRRRRRRRNRCGGNLERPFAACDDRSEGARSKTEKYGRSYTPHG